MGIPSSMIDKRKPRKTSYVKTNIEFNLYQIHIQGILVDYAKDNILKAKASFKAT